MRSIDNKSLRKIGKATVDLNHRTCRALRRPFRWASIAGAVVLGSLLLLVAEVSAGVSALREDSGSISIGVVNERDDIPDFEIRLYEKFLAYFKGICSPPLQNYQLSIAIILSPILRDNRLSNCS